MQALEGGKVGGREGGGRKNQLEKKGKQSMVSWE